MKRVDKAYSLLRNVLQRVHHDFQFCRDDEDMLHVSRQGKTDGDGFIEHALHSGG
mgnify:CR=1 FL=1